MRIRIGVKSTQSTEHDRSFPLAGPELIKLCGESHSVITAHIAPLERLDIAPFTVAAHYPMRRKRPGLAQGNAVTIGGVWGSQSLPDTE